MASSPKSRARKSRPEAAAKTQADHNKTASKMNGFRSSVIQVTSRFSVEFVFDAPMMRSEWSPFKPDNAELQRIIASGAYFEARAKAMGEFARHCGLRIGVADLTPDAIVVTPGGEP